MEERAAGDVRLLAQLDGQGFSEPLAIDMDPSQDLSCLEHLLVVRRQSVSRQLL